VAGSRYIEVFSQPDSDGLNDYLLDEATRDPPGDLSHLRHVVQVRGLPFGWSRGELCRVLRGVDFALNGIYPVRDTDMYTYTHTEHTHRAQRERAHI
jgi:hypothetical protein